MFVAVIPFTREFARISARDFAVRVIWEKLGIQEIYVGPNFAFGHRREGSFNLLKEIGAEKGFFVGGSIKSSFAATGFRAPPCARLCWRARLRWRAGYSAAPSLEGEIVHGAAIGTGIRVPTANLRTLNELTRATGFTFRG